MGAVDIEVGDMSAGLAEINSLVGYSTMCKTITPFPWSQTK